MDLETVRRRHDGLHKNTGLPKDEYCDRCIYEAEIDRLTEVNLNNVLNKDHEIEQLKVELRSTKAENKRLEDNYCICP